MLWKTSFIVSKMKLTAYLLLCILSLVNAYYLDIREVADSHRRLVRSTANCSSTEPYCTTGCSSIAMCINGVEQVIYTCPTNRFCNDDNRKAECGDIQGLKCTFGTKIKFKCAGLGFFPDIISWDKSYFCCRKTTTTSTVPAGSLYDPSINYADPLSDTCGVYGVYDALTGTCDPNQKPGEGYRVKLCQNPGDSFQVEGQIYCVCQQYSTTERVLYPFLYRCKVKEFPCTAK